MLFFLNMFIKSVNKLTCFCIHSAIMLLGRLKLRDVAKSGLSPIKLAHELQDAKAPARRGKRRTGAPGWASPPCAGQ